MLCTREEFAALQSSKPLDVQFVDLSYTTYEMGALYKAALNTQVFLSPNELHLGFRYMVAMLRREGLRAEILYQDARPGTANEDELLQVITRTKANILGFGSYEGSLGEALQFVGRVRAAGSRSLICLGGHLATFSCEEILTRFHDLIDVVVLGEGEHTIVDLARAVKRKQPIQSIPGIAYYDDGRVVRTKPRDVERDLNCFPFPAVPTTIDSGHKDTPLFVITSRGCYGRCSFCRTSQLGDGWRPRNPKNVVDEFEHAHALGVSTFEIVDDNFIGPGKLGKVRAIGIAAELARRNLPIRFHASCRVNDVDENTMRVLRDNGLISVSLGVESGLQRVLDCFNKHTTVAQNLAAVELLDGLNIGVTVYFIFFDPYMTLAEARENIAFLRSLQSYPRVRFERVIFRKLIPVSGTAIFDRLRDDGLLRGNPFDGHYFHFKDWRVALLSEFMESMDLRGESVLCQQGFRQHKDLYRWFKTSFAFALGEQAVDFLASTQCNAADAHNELERLLNKNLRSVFCTEADIAVTTPTMNNSSSQ
jgi:radical SAM superfamily enzyme YgiQ (UPF0313 family)